MAFCLTILAPLAAQDPVPDPVIAVVEPLLDARSPEVRGEAALAVAATRDPRYYQPLLALANDRDEGTRHRALIALGHLGQPGTDAVLKDILDNAPRRSKDRPVAAFALGLLPDEPRIAAVEEFLNRVRAASRKRIRPELSGFLLGTMHAPHPSRRTSLLDLLDDATYRNRPMLTLVLRNLATLAAGLDDARLFELACEENAAVASTALQMLAKPTTKLDKARRQRLVSLAARGKPAVRAAALRVLTEKRIPEALTQANEFLESGDPTLAAQGVRTILALGGGLLRESLEERILLTRNAKLQIAMLRAKKGPHSDTFVKSCLALARDGKVGHARRTQFAAIVVAAGWKDIAPTVTTLFLQAEDATTTRTLARLLKTLSIDIRKKVFPVRSVEDGARLTTRLGALLAVDHGQAANLVLDVLAAKSTTTDLLVEVLRAYRQAVLPPIPPKALELAPEHLRTLLR